VRCGTCLMFSEEGAGEGTKPVEAEPVTTPSQGKTKKSTKEQQIVITNVESLFFANTYLFQGIIIIISTETLIQLLASCDS